MRNSSKTIIHLPKREFKKIVRFNNHDYLLQSVMDNDEYDYDDSFDKELKKRFVTHTVLDDVPWYRNLHRHSRRIVEDFFDDMDDISSEMDDEIGDDVENGSYYINLDNGKSVEIELSEDPIKNAIFFLLVNFVSFSEEEIEDDVSDTDDDENQGNVLADKIYSLDKLIYSYGRSNKLKAYKVDINDIRYEKGSYKLIMSSKANAKGFIEVYFLDNNNVNFKIVYPDINFRRPGNMTVFNYDEFCDLLRNSKITQTPKNADDYYEPIIEYLMDNFRQGGVNVTLCRAKKTIDKMYFGYITSPKLLTQYFTPLHKYNNKKADYSPVINAMNEDNPIINQVFENGQESLFNDDEYYMLIGGNESFIKNIQKSFWNQNIFDSRDYIRIQFKTQDPDLRTRKIEHNMILVPLSRFVIASPALLTFIN